MISLEWHAVAIALGPVSVRRVEVVPHSLCIPRQRLSDRVESGAEHRLHPLDEFLVTLCLQDFEVKSQASRDNAGLQRTSTDLFLYPRGQHGQHLI